MLLENIYKQVHDSWVQKRVKEWYDSDQSEWFDPFVVLSVPNVYLEILFRYQYCIKGLKDIEILIETGTEEGGTTDIMAKHFDKVYTIEKSFFVSKRQHAFETDPANDNVSWLYGDSPKVLADLRHKIKDERCVFFLDAHTSNSSCLVQELKKIKKYFNNESVIIVDDAVDIGKVRGYPTLVEFHRLIEAINPEYTVTFTGLGRNICLVH